MRSLARDTASRISPRCPQSRRPVRLAGSRHRRDLGIGQGDAAIIAARRRLAVRDDPEFGAASQLRDRACSTSPISSPSTSSTRAPSRRAARRAQTVPAQPQLFDTNTDEMPVFGTMAAVSTTTASRAVPGASPRRWWQGPQARQAAPAAGGGEGLQPWPRHRAGRAHPLPGRDRRDGARLPQAHPEQVPHRPRAPGPCASPRSSSGAAGQGRRTLPS